MKRNTGLISSLLLLSLQTLILAPLAHANVRVANPSEPRTRIINYLDSERYLEEAKNRVDAREGIVAIVVQGPLDGIRSQKGPFYFERDRLVELEFFRLLFNGHEAAQGEGSLRFKEALEGRLKLDVSMPTFHKMINRIYLGLFEKDCSRDGAFDFLEQANFMQDRQLMQMAVENLLGCSPSLGAIEALADAIEFLSAHVTLYSSEQRVAIQKEFIHKMQQAVVEARARSDREKRRSAKVLESAFDSAIDHFYALTSEDRLVRMEIRQSLGELAASGVNAWRLGRMHRLEQEQRGEELFQNAKRLVEAGIATSNLNGRRFHDFTSESLGLADVFDYVLLLDSAKIGSEAKRRRDPHSEASCIAGRKLLRHLRLLGYRVKRVNGQGRLGGIVVKW